MDVVVLAGALRDQTRIAFNMHGRQPSKSMTLGFLEDLLPSDSGLS